MKGLTLQVKATVELTAREWQLFTASMDCEAAAKALNEAASEALSCGDSRRAWAIFSRAQNDWAEYGAADSEPSWRFEVMHARVFDV